MDPSQSIAVLIGVTDYPRSDFPPVPAAAENVRRLAAELANERVWGLRRPSRLWELPDPVRADVLTTVRDAAGQVGRDGLLLLSFAGHAETVGGELCLALRDADRGNPHGTMLPVSELVAAASGHRTARRMLVLDCCYSGRAARALPAVSVTVGESAGWYFLGAADGRTEASAPAGAELTLFTEHLLQVLSGVPGGPERLTPADVTRAVAAALPPDHQPVHNDLAWADREPWLRNRRHVPGGEGEGDPDGIPAPPDLYAVPRYLGSHRFVGRASQLERLDDWANAAQRNPVLLFEAIGGTGKSMLTWQWLNHHATGVRADWAGRFWYSFYDSGATMADFCRHAIAYTTGRPLADLRGVKQTALREVLLRQLRSKPWLLVLDGLERVLVAYHRHDASQLADDRAGESDEVAERDPCSAIRPEDDELLRQLADGAPSRILITSRLPPRSLSNRAGQPVPGVLSERLPEAERVWQRIQTMDRDLPRDVIRHGHATSFYIRDVLLPQDLVDEQTIERAERTAVAAGNRFGLRLLHATRGAWRLRRGEPDRAAEAFHEAVRMANEVGVVDHDSETWLALARLRADPGVRPEAADSAGRLSAVTKPAHQARAELWLELGDTAQATVQAQAAYRWAWADGEPYVRRFALDRAQATLRALGVALPAMPVQRRPPHPIERWAGPAAEMIAQLKARKADNRGRSPR